MMVETKLIEVLRLLEAGGLPHAYWKASRRLSEALSGQGDYDLLIPPTRRNECHHRLAEAGFLRFQTRPGNQRPEMAHFVAPSASGLVHLHLHEAPISGDYDVWQFSLGDPEFILSHRQRDEGTEVFRLAPAMELALLVLRAFTEPKMRRRTWRKKSGAPLTEKARLDIDHVWQKVDDQSLRRIITPLYGAPLARQLAAFHHRRISPADPASLARLSPLVTELLPRFRNRPRTQIALASAKRNAVGFSRRVYTRVRPPLLPPWTEQQRLRAPREGLFIAVVGPDGAGKSTLIEHLSQWFSATVDTETIYLGKGSLVSTVWKGLADIKTDIKRLLIPGGKDQSDRTTNPSFFDITRSPLRQRTWELARVSQALRQRKLARRAHHHRGAGRFTIADRFPHPTNRFTGGPGILILDNSCRWTRATAAAERALLRDIAHNTAPDIVLRLAIPAAEACRRAPDHNPADIKRKADAFEDVSYPGAALYSLDATEPPEVVFARAREILWSHLSEESLIPKTRGDEEQVIAGSRL